jgi:LysM repeat protein
MRSFSSVSFLVLIIGTIYSSAQSDQKIAPEEYILAYKEIAITEMNRSGIPASISLAQGMLESDYGNSRLAREANNHFGIKCHGWTGNAIYHDDDDKNECFRKYESAEDSYMDHTDFLMDGTRYVLLFNLDHTNYKGWAKGLEKAGYATSRSYSRDLIRIIEENALYAYDRPLKKRKKKEEIEKAELAGESTAMIDKAEAGQTRADSVKTTDVETTQHKILTRNRINYIITNEGDTYPGISEEFELLPFELARYNEIERNAPFEPGRVLYLQPKRNKASVEYKYHTVAEGETMYQISNLYGIKLDKLYQKNLMKEGTEPSPGDVLSLRKQKKGEVPEEDVLEEEAPKIEFEE